MALYWPQAKVALEILDDPASKPYEGPDNWSVLHVAREDIRDLRRFRKVAGELCRLLGEDVSFMDDPEWQQGNAELHERLMEEFWASPHQRNERAASDARGA